MVSWVVCSWVYCTGSDGANGSGGGHLLTCHTNPCHGVANMGAAPYDAVFTEGASETVGVVDIGRPLATPLIEGTEGCRLDSEGSGGHWSFALLNLL